MEHFINSKHGYLLRVIHFQSLVSVVYLWFNLLTQVNDEVGNVHVRVVGGII